MNWEEMRLENFNSMVKTKEANNPEYHTKKYYIVTRYRGNFSVNTKAYHPGGWYGTEAEHDRLTFKYYDGREDEFKIDSTVLFESINDYEKNLKIK